MLFTLWRSGVGEHANFEPFVRLVLSRKLLGFQSLLPYKLKVDAVAVANGNETFRLGDISYETLDPKYV